MKKPQPEDFLTPKPIPEDFGMTFREYEQAKAVREKRTEWAWSELWASYGISILLGLILAVLGANLLLCFSVAGIGPVVVLPIWFIVLPFIGGLQGSKNGYNEDPISQKVRLYEHAMDYYKKAPIRYEQAIAAYNQTLEEHWKSLRGKELEEEIANLYRRIGYTVSTTRATGDKGVDLILEKDGRGIIVQCKGYEKPAGVGVARDLYGTLMDIGSGNAVLVCPAGFTKGVSEFVRGKPIKLIDAGELVIMAESLEQGESLLMQEQTQLVGHCLFDDAQDK
jgi:hypothetical protein